MSENVQISKNLFMWCYLIIVENNKDENLKKITSEELEKKFSAIIKRDLYTKYKTAKNKEEKEKSRKEYLKKIGLNENFKY